MSTIGSSLKTNEKLFISWVGPRGIVAAGIASLFGTKLVEQGIRGAEYITPLVFAVVLATVLLNAATARLFARLVGVFLTTSESIIIVGASKPSRVIGKYLKKNKRDVVLIDTNANNINLARELGLDSLNANIYEGDLTDNIEFNDVGYLIAMTGNDEINRYALTKYSATLGENGSFRLMSDEERKNGLQNGSAPSEVLSTTHDYADLTRVANEFPSIQEIDIDSAAVFQRLLDYIYDHKDMVALFLKAPDGELSFITNPSEMEVEEGSQLAYLGKTIDVESVLQNGSNN